MPVAQTIPHRDLRQPAHQVGRAAYCRAGRYVCTLSLYSEEEIMSCGLGREEASRTAHADG